MVGAAPTREQKFSRHLGRSFQVVVDGLAGLIRQLELDGRPVFFCRTVARSIV